ncbi:MAG TPA: protein kinase [Blastocatellia bacterium]|nr:protein kinase [Blastocatellia bacterium]
MISQTISHYRILKKLGAGGMGEVYKAQDITLGRPVALKILPAHLVEDADRVRRFIQEAKSASALNHPHIITIYEIGQAQADATGEGESQDANSPGASASTNGARLIHYIAMEFIDGTTLSAKIHREKTELKKLLEFLTQTADGLAKAHAAGIVHRDLKPDNIMITEDGYAKILDFGLAKLVEPQESPDGKLSSEDLEEAATAMMDRTRPGVVMGTIGYMSPEQVQGKAVDQRSDIFSFGCILYEAATGVKPFAGDSAIDTMHRIVYTPAPLLREKNPNAPVELQRIIRKCLAKDPAERYQSIKDAALDLRELVKEYDSQPLVSGAYPQMTSSGEHAQAPIIGPVSQPSSTNSQPQDVVTGEQKSLVSGPVSGAVPVPPQPQRGKRAFLWIPLVAGLAIAIIVGLLFVLRSYKGSTKLTGPAFQNTRITKLTSTGKSGNAAISPDGKYVAHVVNDAGQSSLWVRQVATLSNVQIIPPAEVNYIGLTFSPDGNYVYYVKGEKGQLFHDLFQIPVLGGNPKKLIADIDSAVTFSPDGKRFAFLRGYPLEGEFALMVANADGTGEQKLAAHKLADRFLQAAWSPDGKVIACTTQSLEGGFHTKMVAVRVADGAETPVGAQKWRFTAGLGWLADGSGLMVSAIDQTPGSNQFQIWHLSYPGGEARRITNDLNNYAGVSMPSDSSALVTLQTDASANVFIAPGGDASAARQVTSGTNTLLQVFWTPEGKIVYVTDAGGNLDIWMMDADGKNQKQLTADAGINVFASASPDGRHIFFSSNRAGNAGILNVWRMDSDGSNAKQLTSGEGEYWPVCTPDGKWVIYTSATRAERPGLWKIPAEGGEPVRISDKIALQPVLSPDGKLIACWYSSGDPLNPPKVAIIPVEGGEPIRMIDVKGFNFELSRYRWSPDGKALLYVENRGGVSNIWRQPLDGSPAKQVTDFQTDIIFSFDWSRDGRQLACARGVTTTDAILIRDLAHVGGK